jgi:cobalt-zinc-cadmium efflux system outer membrane protein
VFVWTTLVLPAAGLAQPVSIPEKLTLADALRLAAERNPVFAAARNAVEIAEAQRIDAALRPNPAVSVESEGYPLLENQRPSFLNNQEFTIRVDQEIETAGRRGLRTRAAAAGIDVARLELQDRLRQLELDVRRTYFQAVLAKADLDVARGTLDEIDRVITLSRARLAQGETSGAELRRLQVERLRFIDDVFTAELALRNARSSLLALLNAPDLSQTVDVVEPLAAPPGSGPVRVAAATGAPLDPAALGRQAGANRPDLVAVRRDVERAETETRLQRALRTPNVTIGGGYRRDFGTNAVVFGVTIPLPIAGRNQGGVARAEAERRLAANRLAATEVAVQLDVQQAFNAVDVNRTRVEYIEREVLKNARESRDIVLASYRLGAADLIDFLDAQRAFRDTLRTYNRALFDERISLFQLKAALGGSGERQ